MKNKHSLWLITGLLLIGYFLLEIKVFSNHNFSKLSGRVSLAFGIITNLLFVLGFGFVYRKMAALFLYTKLPHPERFQRTFPIATSFALLVMLLFFSFITYIKHVEGVRFSPLVQYDEVEIPSNTNCTDVRNGIFETESISIKRSNKEQVQTNKANGKIIRYRVKWLSDCEYALTQKENPAEKLKVKIVEVRDDAYDCFVTSNKYADKQTIKRVKTNVE